MAQKEPPRPLHEEGDDFTTAPLDATHASRWTPPRALRGRRGRAATLAATALLVVVVVAGLFARATSDPSSAVATLLRLPTPTPAATFVPGANVIYLSNGAPWGILTLDGKRAPAIYALGFGFSVTRGRHYLVYQARYFPTLRCTFSAPRAQSDTCPLDTTATASQFLRTQGLARVIDLGSTGATLQSDQRIALIQLADALLARQTLTATIAPGDRYLDDQGRLETATAPLHFTMTPTLGVTEAPGVNATCYQFCPDPIFSSGGNLTNGQWLTRLTVTADWAITDASGRRLSGLTYQAGLRYGATNPVEVGIQLTPSGWRINGLGGITTLLIINAAGMMVDRAVSEAGGGAYGSAILEGQNPLGASVMDVSFAGQSARLLWRFGALLAVDAAAHRLFPQLPVATPAEQALADSIGQPQRP